MAEVSGARRTDNVEQSIRKIDMVPTIKELEPSATPLTVLSTAMPSKDAVNSTFKWTEDDLPPRFDAINNGAGYTNADTSLIVDNGAYFAAEELWKVTRTAEIIRISSIATNTLTAVRGIGGGAAAILDNDELMKLSSAHAENALSPDPTSNNPTPVTNYTQIVRDSYEASGTWMNSANETSPMDWDRTAEKKMIDHKLKIEQMYLHGKPTETGTPPRRTTGGAYNYVQTNRTDMGGTMTEDEFLAGFNPIFRYGNQDAKTAFASRLSVQVVNGFPRGKIEVIQADNDKTYGLKVMKFRSAFGDLNFIMHNMLEGAVYGGHILILDMSNLRKRPMRNRDTHLRENIETPGQDGRKDEILTESGLEFGLEKTHGIFSGITG